MDLQTSARLEFQRAISLAVETYGARIARKVILKRYCPIGHPVLEVEIQLVEMAAAKLMEIIEVTTSNIDEIAHAVLESAATKLRGSDEDDQVKILALLEIRRMSIADIFPRLH